MPPVVLFAGAVDGVSSAAEHLDFLQFGALGVLMVVLVLIYRISATIVETKLRQSSIPNGNGQHLTYNEQMARLIYDTSKSLSEVVVMQGKMADVLRDIHSKQERHVEMMQDHVNDTKTFITDYKKKMLGHI